MLKAVVAQMRKGGRTNTAKAASTSTSAVGRTTDCFAIAGAGRANTGAERVSGGATFATFYTTHCSHSSSPFSHSFILSRSLPVLHGVVCRPRHRNGRGAPSSGFTVIYCCWPVHSSMTPRTVLVARWAPKSPIWLWRTPASSWPRSFLHPDPDEERCRSSPSCCPLLRANYLWSNRGFGRPQPIHKRHHSTWQFPQPHALLNDNLSAYLSWNTLHLCWVPKYG
ncbi:hypothetical protein B0H11DRAFT_1339507 [Mycena galericulata]|nr:hypothetical protein B0H11DRAFT_1339507 [Mycena galericulata]